MVQTYRDQHRPETRWLMELRLCLLSTIQPTCHPKMNISKNTDLSTLIAFNTQFKKHILKLEYVNLIKINVLYY